MYTARIAPPPVSFIDIDLLLISMSRLYRKKKTRKNKQTFLGTYFEDYLLLKVAEPCDVNGAKFEAGNGSDGLLPIRTCRRGVQEWTPEAVLDCIPYCIIRLMEQKISRKSHSAILMGVCAFSGAVVTRDVEKRDV